MKKVRIEYDMDEETFRHVLDAILRKYEDEVRFIPGEKLSDFLDYLLTKKKEVLA